MPNVVAVHGIERGREQEDRRGTRELQLGAPDADHSDVDLGPRRFARVLAVDQPLVLLWGEGGQGEHAADLDVKPIGGLLVDQHLVDPNGLRATSFEQERSIDDPSEPVIGRAILTRSSSSSPVGATNKNGAGATASTCGRPAISSKYSGLTSTEASWASSSSSRRG